MSATFLWCERNGASPGSVTEGVSNVNWKAVDNTTTAYNNLLALIPAGTNSFTKWQYGKFTGAYTNIANVNYIHQTGILGPGIAVRGPKSMTQDSDRLSYITPTKIADNVHTTPINMSNVLTSVGVFVGPLLSGSDGPGSSGKAVSAAKPGGDGALYTNYLTTQLQTLITATPGDTTPVIMRLQYDES